MRPQRQDVRLASKLLAACARSPSGSSDSPAAVRDLLARFRTIEQALRRANLAAERGWDAAARCARHDLRRYLDRLEHAAAQARETLEMAGAPRASNWVDVLAELDQLRAEFGGLEVHWSQRYLAVQTEPVVLGGVELGRFSVRLFWDRLARAAEVSCFDVVALDPNPPAGHRSVTHPHVKDDALCAGDAQRPLRQALRQGRFADAFCLIRSVLFTYNPDSPHARLEEWDGASCYDCGRSVDEEDRRVCDACGNDLCEDCTGSCTGCDRVLCPGCACRCEKCDARCCSGCLRSCAASGRECCSGCLHPCAQCEALVALAELDEEDNCCPDCQAPAAAVTPPAPDTLLDSTTPEPLAEDAHVP